MSTAKHLQNALTMVDSKGSDVLNMTTTGGKEVTPGEFRSRTDLQDPPIMTYNGDRGDKYVVVKADLDAPYPSMNFVSPIAHWIQSDMTLNESNQLVKDKDTIPIASYRPPRPPPMSSPHRYVTLVYKQPPGFQYKDHLKPGGVGWSMMESTKFDLDGFLKKSGIDTDPVAVHYFKSK